MSSGIDELIASLPRVSDEQLEAWFSVVVKTKAEFTVTKGYTTYAPNLSVTIVVT